VIKPGQLIHVSVAFKGNEWTPKAVLPKGWTWDMIIGSKANVEWSGNLRDILEMDLSGFEVDSLIKPLQSRAGNLLKYLQRLRVLASDGMLLFHWYSQKLIGRMILQETGKNAIAKKGSETLIMFLEDGSPELQFASAVVLHSVVIKCGFDDCIVALGVASTDRFPREEHRSLLPRIHPQSAMQSRD
jgi:hypothetical protein